MSYYVTAKRTPSRVAWLAGPFNRHGDALRFVEAARREACNIDPACHWDAFGTTHLLTRRDKVGKLNDRLGLTAEDLTGRS